MKELQSDALKTKTPWKTGQCVRWCIAFAQEKNLQIQPSCLDGSKNLTTSHFGQYSTFLQLGGKKKVFSKLPSLQVWVLTEDCSDLCISNRLRASISDLCFSFEISPISNLPILTHWAECLMSQKWQNRPIAFNTAAEQKKMPVCRYRWLNNSTCAIHQNSTDLILQSLFWLCRTLWGEMQWKFSLITFLSIYTSEESQFLCWGGSYYFYISAFQNRSIL